MHTIAHDIHWVGYIDWNLRNFHGYATPFGSTYNAYLILDEHPTLIDTVKSYGFSEMLSRIQECVDPSAIKYIVSNHTEMDHSGCIDALLQYCPSACVVCSEKGAQGLKRHFKKNWNLKIVKEADTLSIGKRTLQFFPMPMVHWPDSMASYSLKDNILFPNDAFGQHYASAKRFADEVGIDIVLKEASKYYANIVMPYGAQVLKALGALGKLKLDMICPSHGLMYRRSEDIEKIISCYKKWANYESEKRVVIVYDTMWHSTQILAHKLFELIEKENIDVTLIDLSIAGFSDTVNEIMNSRVLLMGSPILNNRILPSVGGFLTYIKGLQPQKRFAATFGSYGWSKKGFAELESSLQEAGMQLLLEGKYFQYIPDDDEIKSLSEIVAQVKERLA